MSQNELLSEAREFFEAFEKTNKVSDLELALLNLQEILDEPESSDMKNRTSNLLKTFHRKILENGKSILRPDWNPKANAILNCERMLSAFSPFLESYLSEDAQQAQKQIMSDLRGHPHWIPDLVASLSNAQKEQLSKLLN